MLMIILQEIIELEIIPPVIEPIVIDPITSLRPIVEVIEEPQTGGVFLKPPIPEYIEEIRAEGLRIPTNRVPSSIEDMRQEYDNYMEEYR